MFASAGENGAGDPFTERTLPKKTDPRPNLPPQGRSMSRIRVSEQPGLDRVNGRGGRHAWGDCESQPGGGYLSQQPPVQQASPAHSASQPSAQQPASTQPPEAQHSRWPPQQPVALATCFAAAPLVQQPPVQQASPAHSVSQPSAQQPASTQPPEVQHSRWPPQQPADLATCFAAPCEQHEGASEAQLPAAEQQLPSADAPVRPAGPNELTGRVVKA